MKWRLLEVLIVLMPVAVFSYLAFQEVVPTGVFPVAHAVGDSSPFIDRLLPDARVQEPGVDGEGDHVQEIVDEPAFFFVHPHRAFKAVGVDVWFKNQDNPIVELGGLARTDPEVYDLHPLQNQIIDRLNWPRLEMDGLLLLQRTQTHASIADFLANPPPRYQVATYHASLTAPYRIAGYHPASTTQTVDVTLRGAHAYQTYVKDETLNVTADFMDMNRAEGADAVSLIAFDENGNAVGEARVDDDGNVSTDARPSPMRHLALAVPNLPEGVYKVELQANRDIFFRHLATTQQKIVFLNELYLGDEVAYQPAPRSVAFWTEAKSLAFETQHAEGLQDIRVGGGIVSVSQPYTRSSIAVKEDGVVKVAAPKTDLLVHSNGHIAFHPEQFFNPDTVRLDADTDLDRLNVAYVLARYAPPERKGNWLVAHVSFDPSRFLTLPAHTWKFVFSIPGIAARKGTLSVGRTDFIFTREPFHLADLLPSL